MEAEASSDRIIWSDLEIRRLIELYVENKDLLEKRHSSDITEKKNKQACWLNMTQQITILGGSRTEKQLKKKIRDLKTNARKWLSGSKRPPTGGGKPTKKPWYADVLIDEIIGNDSTTLGEFGGRKEASNLFGTMVQAHRKGDNPDCDPNAALAESTPPLPSLEIDSVCVPTPLPCSYPPTITGTPKANGSQHPTPLPHSHPPTTIFSPTANEKRTTQDLAGLTRLTPCPRRAASARRAIEVHDDDDEDDTPCGQRLQQDRRPYKHLLRLEIERATLKLKATREDQEMHEIALKRQKISLEIDHEKLKNLKLKNKKLEQELLQMQQPAESVQFLTLSHDNQRKTEFFTTYD